MREPTPFKSAAQKRYKKLRRKNDLSGRGGHKNPKIGSPYTVKPKGAGRDRLRFEGIREEIDNLNISSLELQDTLNPDIWVNSSQMSDKIRKRLLQIANDFLKETDIDIEAKDVVLTGSLANYNWSSYSDFDLHIVIEYKDLLVGEEMGRKFLNSLRSAWNNKRQILIKGYEVEIYLEDVGEPHVSTGVYSLHNEKWIIEPVREEGEIDYEGVTKKSLDKMQEIDNIQTKYDDGDYEDALESAKRLKNKIKKMRKSGLDRSGVFSNENLTFKVLRRNGELERLFSLMNQSRDKIMSLDENLFDAR
tara:strand:- start:2184 stop:3098 length:915 start_codon:yes stop_codon:yes gene_type:complete